MSAPEVLRLLSALLVGATIGYFARDRNYGIQQTEVPTVARAGIIRRLQQQYTSTQATAVINSHVEQHRGVRINSHGLFATVHLAFLDHFGAITVPNATRRIFIEIGCSDRDTMDADGSLEKDPEAFLISFEPLLDKYATLLARGGPRHNGRGVLDRAVPLGHHHPRGIVLPIAISHTATQHNHVKRGGGGGGLHGPGNGVGGSGISGGGGLASGLTTINVSRIAGCSSLVAFNENTT